MGHLGYRSAPRSDRHACSRRARGSPARGSTHRAAESGARLPSSRALAADLGIARNTVAEAYGQLVAEGWLTAQAGSGTRVAQRGAPAPMSPSPIASVGARTRYDLRPGTPDLAAFPRAGWLAAARRALSAAPFEALGYDRHVRRSRLAYRRRRDRLLAALRQAVPDVSVTGIAAGLHALVQLRDDDDEDDVITRALEHGLSLEGLGAYLEAPSRHPPALVVGYGTPPEHAFTAAIARLCAVLAAGA